MPGETDTRIVEMHFENRQFERNIAKSQKSLEDFKKELDFEQTSKGLRHFASGIQALDFQQFSSNIQRLTDKFTGLGDAGEYVLSSIRHSLESTAMQMESFVKSFTTAQISVGQSKYDAMNKAAMSLISAGTAEDQAYGVFERIMAYTDQTSANFENMVGNLQSFKASGQGLWESEKALEGIFNMTAKAGKGATEASNAMNVFSKAMGMGHLSLNQWESLTLTAKITTDEFRKELVEAGLAAGTLVKNQKGQILTNKKYGKQVEVTAQNVQSTLNKKWADNSVIMALANKYYFDFEDKKADLEGFAGTAYKCAQRALTFSDAMQAIKESISSGWMQTFQIVFGRVGDAMEFFTALCEGVIDVLYGIQEARNKVLSTWASGGGRRSIIESILGSYGNDVEAGAYGLLDLFKDIGSLISDGFWDMVKIFAQGDERINWDRKGYKEAFLGRKLRDLSDNIRNFIKSIRDFFTSEIKIGDTTTSRIELIRNIIRGIGAALVLAINGIRGVIGFMKGLKTQLQPAIDVIYLFFSAISEMLRKTAYSTNRSKGINSFFQTLLQILKPITTAINVIVFKMADLLLSFLVWGKQSGFFQRVFTSLGNVFRAIGKIINRIAIPVLTFFGDLFDIFTQLFKGGMNPKDVANLGNNIRKALDKMISSIFGVESMEKLGEKMKETLGSVLKGFLDYIPENVRNAFKDLFGLWGDDVSGKNNSVFTRIRKFFTGGFDTIFGALKKIFGSFKNFNLVTLLKTKFGLEGAYSFLGEVAGWFKGTNLYGVIMAFLGVATLWSLFRVINNVRKIGTNLKWAIGEIGDSLKSGFKVRYDDYGEYLMKMAEGIAIFVGCVAVLGSLDTMSLVQGVVSLALIMGMVILFNKMLKKDFAKDTMGNQVAFAAQLIAIGAAITTITLAIAVLMLAILPLSKDAGRMFMAVLGVAAIFATLGVFIHFMLQSMVGFAKSIAKDGKPGMKEFLGISVLLIALGASIAIMAVGISMLLLALIPLANAGWEGMLRAVVGFVLIMAALGVFIHLMLKELIKWSVILGDAKKTNITKLGAILILLATSVTLLAEGIGMLILATVPLSLMSWEGFVRAILGLGLVMLELLAFMKIIQKMSMNDKALSIKVAGLAGFAASIGLLVLALMPLAVLKWEAWLRAILGLGLVMLELAGFIKIIQMMSVGDKTLSVKIAGLAGFAAGIGVLILALVPLALVSWEGMLRMMGGLALVLLELAGFIKLVQMMSAGDRKLSVKIAGLAGLAIGVGILILALIPLSAMPLNGMIQAIVGLTAVMLVLALFVKAVEGIQIKASKMFSIILLSAGLLLIGVTLSTLASMPLNSMVQAIVGLTAVMLVLALFMKVIESSGIKGGAGALIAMVGIALMLLTVSLVLNEIKNINNETLVTFFGGVAALVLAMAGVILVLSAVPLAAGIKAISLLAVAIAAIVGVLALVIPMLLGAVGSSLAEFGAKLTLVASLVSDFSDKMKATDDSGVDKADVIFGKLKTLMGKLRGFGDYSNDIRKFTTALFDLSTGLEIWENHTKDLKNPEASYAFKMVDKVLTYAGMLQGFGIGNFATELYTLGVGAYAFDYLGNDMEDPENSKPLRLIKALAGCATDLQILSSIGLDGLKSQLAGLGGAMSLYADGAKEITGIKGDQTTNAQGAVAILQAITSALVENGGFVLPEIPHEAELGSFGADLAALAGALVKFTNASSGLGSGTDKAVDLLNFLGGELKTKLTSDNLRAANAFKDSGITPYGLAEFALDIIGLGKAISAFVDSTQGIDDAKISAATKALGVFADIKGQLVGQDVLLSVINWFTGEGITNDQLTQFGKDIEALGLALKAFATSVTWGEKEQGSFQQALDALGFLSDLKTKLPEIGGLKEIFAGRKQTLTDLGGEIEALGVAISDFNGKIVDENGNSKLNIAAMDGAIAVLEHIVTFMTEMQGKLAPIGGIFSWFTGRPFNFKDLTETVGDLDTTFGQLARLTGILVDENGESKIINTTQLTPALDVLDTITTFMTSLQTKMPSVGGLVNGFVQLVEGEPYDLEKLKTDITSFGSVCSELARIKEILLGEDGSVKIVTAEDITPATSAIDVILQFTKDLGAKMGEVGGAVQAFNGLIFGSAYSFDNLTSDLGDFTSALDELNKIAAILNGDEQEGHVVDQAALTNAIGTFGTLTSFIRELSNSMPSVGGLMNLGETILHGKQYGLQDLANDLGYLGEGIGKFNSGLGTNFNSDIVQSAVGVVSSISDIIIAMSRIGTGSYVDVHEYIGKMQEMFDLLSYGYGEMKINGVGVGMAEYLANMMMIISDAVDDYGADSTLENLQRFAALTEALANWSGIDTSQNFNGIGVVIGTGITEGLKSCETLVATETQTLIGLIASTIEENLDTNPTITPVLDLTQFQQDLATMNSWLTTGSAPVIDPSTAARLAASYIPATGTDANQNGTDLSGVYNRMDTIWTRIDQLGSDIAKMKVILNTGVIAGAVAPMVDEYIGEQYSFNTREG